MPTEVFDYYILPLEFPNKNYYYQAIYDISTSLTSKEIIDISNSSRINWFIEESAQLLANSIKLFEQGYFDAAFYSLRTAIELSITMLDLSDQKDYKIKKNMIKFLKKEYRVKRYQTVNHLSKWGIIFKDISEKMPEFLDEIEKTSKYLNDRIHKSNFESFYVIHNLMKDDENYLKNHIFNFKILLESSIRIVAIMRLILDPIPLLMADEEIYYRIANFTTYSFNNVLFEIIGENTLIEFKQTASYMAIREEIMESEKRSEYVNSVVMSNYIDLKNLDNIYKQKHLLDDSDLMCVNIANCSKKIMRIVFGIARYSTNLDDYEITNTFLDFDKLCKLENSFNLKFDNNYISILNLCSDNLDANDIGKLIYILHNNKFSEKEINKLKKIKITPYLEY